MKSIRIVSKSSDLMAIEPELRKLMEKFCKKSGYEFDIENMMSLLRLYGREELLILAGFNDDKLVAYAIICFTTKPLGGKELFIWQAYSEDKEITQKGLSLIFDIAHYYRCSEITMKVKRNPKAFEKLLKGFKIDETILRRDVLWADNHQLKQNQ